MAPSTFRSRQLRRSWKSVVVTTILAGLAVVFVAGSSANLVGSSFEGNDGNLIVNTPGNTDWANAPNLVTGIDQPSGTSDDSFGQGTKEDDPNVTVVTGSIPPNKNDLTRFYISSEYSGGNNFLYLGWERAVNTGKCQSRSRDQPARDRWVHRHLDGCGEPEPDGWRSSGHLRLLRQWHSDARSADLGDQRLEQSVLLEQRHRALLGQPRRSLRRGLRSGSSQHRHSDRPDFGPAPDGRAVRRGGDQPHGSGRLPARHV